MTPQSRGASNVLCERELTIVGHYRHDSDIHGAAAFSAVAVRPVLLPVENRRSEDNKYYSMTIVP